MNDVAYFQLAFRPNLTLVSTVRRFVAQFYNRVLTDPDASSRLALATHELLENAVGYARDGETTVRIEVSEEKNQILVRTWNRATPEDIVALKKLIDELNGAEDPDVFYQELLIRSARRTDGSGLGLARIRAEAEMRVNYQIEEDHVVCILAQTSCRPDAES